MATVILRGDAQAVAQVNTVTPANVLVTNTFTLTQNGKTVTFTAAAATVANVTAGLVALLPGTNAEFQEETAADGTTVLTLTASTPGVPFTQTSSAAGGTATLVTAITTASAGPNDWSIAKNWSGAAVPVSTDDVYLQNSSVSILYGLNQTGVALTSLSIAANYTGQIGLPNMNSNGYYEYRAKFLVIGATTVNIGLGTGSGSSRIKLDMDGGTPTFNILSTGQPAEQGLPAVLLKNFTTNSVINIQQGSVGVAVQPAETATITTLRIGSQQSPATDVNFTCGIGCTTTTVNMFGGTLALNNGATTVNIGQGVLNTLQAGAITTINARPIDGAKVTINYGSSGTLTTLVLGPRATIDFSKDPRAKTVTNCSMYPGSTLLDPNKVVTFTNGIILVDAALEDVTLEIGNNITLTRS